MEGAARRKRFTWSEQQTIAFIRMRMEKEAHFTGHRNASIQGFELVLKEMNLEKVVSPAQASKKWENLKRKYRDLILPRSRSGRECGESTAASWPYFEEMQRAMGDKDGDKPLDHVLTAAVSAVDQPRSPSPGPSTSTDPQPGASRPKPKRKNEVLEYLREYGERQEKRQRELDARKEERERRREQQLDTLIAIFTKLVENHK